MSGNEDPPESDEVAVSVQAERPVQRAALVVVIALAIAALPLVLAAVHHSNGASAAAREKQSQAQTAPSADLPALEAAARENPSLANRLNLALGYINAGQPGVAKRMLQDITRTDSTSVAAWNDLCAAQVQQMELKDGVASCERAVALDPSFQLAKNNLAWANSEVKAERQALAKQDAVAAPNRDRDYFLAQGMHRMHLGEYEAAVQSWQRMLVFNSHDAVAANNIGTALMLEHQPAAATLWFEKAIAWDGSLQIAKNNLAWAKQEMPAR